MNNNNYSYVYEEKFKHTSIVENVSECASYSIRIE